MMRQYYFNYIVDKLTFLAQRIENKGALNILDLNIYSENFYLHFMNELFGWNLININTVKQNAEGIDLIDDSNKVIIQVSSTSTMSKINNALSKDAMKNYDNYSFKFISIAGDARNLRKRTDFNVPSNIKFVPSEDILDLKVILKIIQELHIDKLARVFDLIRKELGNEPNQEKFDTNLAIIINILSNEDLRTPGDDEGPNVNPFEIERKIQFNGLDIAKFTIDDYKIYNARLEKKYKEFDKLGVNKSLAVLDKIRNEYINLLREFKNDDADAIFYKVVERVREIVVNSANYTELAVEELEVCVKIVVVDAFIRCKIFKNPEGYEYVIT